MSLGNVMMNSVCLRWEVDLQSYCLTKFGLRLFVMIYERHQHHSKDILKFLFYFMCKCKSTKQICLNIYRIDL